MSISGEAIEILIEYLKTRPNAMPYDRLFLTKRNGFDLEPQDVRKMVRVFCPSYL